VLAADGVIWLRDEEVSAAKLMLQPPRSCRAQLMIWKLTATLATNPYLGHTSATVHALAAARDLAVCYA
jgi:hypothetical protein